MVCTTKSPPNHYSSPVPGLLFPTQKKEKQQLQEARNREKKSFPAQNPGPGEGGSQGGSGTARGPTGRRDDCRFAQHWPWSRLNNAPLLAEQQLFFLFQSPYYMKGKAELDLPFGFVLLII